MIAWRYLASWIHLFHAVATLTTVTTTLSLTTGVWGCPQQCQCPQPYFVYCQRLGLNTRAFIDLLPYVPYDAVLLDLESNSVDRVHSGTLDTVTNLEYLVLTRNHLTFLGLSIFSPLRQLKELNLSHNRLKTVDPNIFFGLQHLRTLYLDHNVIGNISERAFNLPAIEEMYLNDNNLTRIGRNQLCGLRNLLTLDLSDNLIHTLDVGAFRFLERLHTLRLSRNRLASLADNVFEGLTSLRELYMEGNLLPSLDCFEVANFASTLQRLELSRNALVAVPVDVFTKLKALKTLALDHNHIAQVGSHAFSGLELDNLTLSHNLLETIQREMLEGVRRLALLDLSHNSIRTIQTGAFDSFRESAYVLNLAGNRLGTLDHGMFRGMRNLLELNLSSNALWSILDGTFREVSRLRTLDLDHNELQWLSAGLLEGPSLEWLSALDNPLRELRGFTFSNTTFPVEVRVNLTVAELTTTTFTVIWPYKQGAQLYWNLKLWCVNPVCDVPLQERSMPPNKVSETISGLRPGGEYYVCVWPIFLSQQISVSQCAQASTLRHRVTTTGPQSQGNHASGSAGLTLRGNVFLLCSCVLVSAMVIMADVLMKSVLGILTCGHSSTLHAHMKFVNRS